MSARQIAARQNEIGRAADIGGYALARSDRIAGADRFAHIGMKSNLPNAVILREDSTAASSFASVTVITDHGKRTRL
jgi:hypothetical protein